MPLNVQCKACANLINNWCKPVCDSPDPDLPRDCSHYRTLKNSDRLRAMTDEELAAWLATLEIKAYKRCGYKGNEKRFRQQYCEWLRSPVDGGAKE